MYVFNVIFVKYLSPHIVRTEALVWRFLSILYLEIHIFKQFTKCSGGLDTDPH
jgi:hypothetical protein